MECCWQVEIDDYATRVLEKHWPEVRRWRDITTFPPKCRRVRDGANVLPKTDWYVDVICGGFPCQDISYAGRGEGLEGERSGLFFETLRVVRQLRPKYVLLENVAALLTRGLDRVLGDWGRSGMTQNGIAYRLPPLVPRISGTGCSSSPELPTPKSSDAERGGRGELLALVRGKKTRQKWPTPSSRDWKDSPGMSKTGINPDGTTRERNDQLARRVYSEDQTPANGGQWNPTWVEWLMGFPLGWTDLEDLRQRSRAAGSGMDWPTNYTI
jgi:hypothetical protein